jgi:hypothetical protein
MTWHGKQGVWPLAISGRAGGERGPEDLDGRSNLALEGAERVDGIGLGSTEPDFHLEVSLDCYGRPVWKSFHFSPELGPT